jgi:NTE family protein
MRVQAQARPRVAVVLSGGSAKGLAEIGALQVIEEMHIPIDIVTGTSMGAIIGGLYAAGYSGHELEALIDAEDWGTFFKRPIDRKHQTLTEKLDDQRFTISFPLEKAIPQLPAGAISRQAIAAHLERYLWPVHDITDFSKLPTSFGALVTDLATGDAILMRSGSLAQAVEASAAVPGVFAPLRLADGRRVIDGAVNRNIPAEDARVLGADILICVDVSERILPADSLRSLFEIIDQTVAFRVQASNAVERPLCTVVIEPDITGMSSLEFARGTTWISRGRSAAFARTAQLQAIADTVAARRGSQVAQRVRPPTDSVFVRTVRWSKVTEGADAIVRGVITLHDSMWVTQRLVEAVATRAFSTGRFHQVSYRIVPHDGAHDLIYDLTERDRDLLGVGIRYDTPRGVALLASASVTDFISPGSTASVSARLGEIQQFDARDVLGEGLNARFLQTYHVTLTRTTLPLLSLPGATSAAVLDVHEIGAEVARTLARGVVFGLQLGQEWSHDGAMDASGPYAKQGRTLTTLGASLSVDSRDRNFAPTRGTAFFWRSEFADPSLGSGGSFARQDVDAQTALLIVPGVSLLGGAHFGTAVGPDLPLHDWFFLGGSVPTDAWSAAFVPFFGLNPQSAAGRSVQVLQAGVQADAPYGLIVALRGNVGNVFDRWPGVHGNVYQSGVGLSVSTMLAPGPLSVSLATRSWSQRPIVEVGFGASF